MTRVARAVSVGVLEYPGAQAAAVYGLKDLLDAANHLAKRVPGLDVRILRGEETSPGPGGCWSVLVIPPSLQGRELAFRSIRWLEWIRACHRAGTIVCSVCVGTFLLAETGLLAGRPATTHWALKEAFAERYPDVALDTDRLVVDDGDLVTAGGIMAWVDLGLALIERLLGPTVMLNTARYFLVDPRGREQRFYSLFSPVLTHGDTAVLRVQHWLQGRSAEKLTLAVMAAKAQLGGRTFLRRFRKATGLTPVDYVQHLRVVKARELLEGSDLNVDQIAGRVGYEDTGAFRRVFQRIMGLSPSEYRRRFSCAR